jgi:hypothetical protein
MQTNYKVSADLDGLIASEATLKSVGTAFEWGLLHANLTAVSADSNTASIDNSAASSNGAAAYLFITAVSAGDTIQVKVQDSADNSAWTDLITFTLTGSAIGAERVTVAGAVKRYTRVLYDVTGTGVSFNFAVIFCRQ